jgi:hypothetical protein
LASRTEATTSARATSGRGGAREPELYLYVVENVRQGDPSLFALKVLGGDLLARLLERSKEQRYFTVPWPVATYDGCPTTDD